MLREIPIVQTDANWYYVLRQYQYCYQCTRPKVVLIQGYNWYLLFSTHSLYISDCIKCQRRVLSNFKTSSLQHITITAHLHLNQLRDAISVKLQNKLFFYPMCYSPFSIRVPVPTACARSNKSNTCLGFCRSKNYFSLGLWIL